MCMNPKSVSVLDMILVFNTDIQKSCHKKKKKKKSCHIGDFEQ